MNLRDYLNSIYRKHKAFNFQRHNNGAKWDQSLLLFLEPLIYIFFLSPQHLHDNKIIDTFYFHVNVINPLK
jgi:hypothetical protein